MSAPVHAVPARSVHLASGVGCGDGTGTGAGVGGGVGGGDTLSVPDVTDDRSYMLLHEVFNQQCWSSWLFHVQAAQLAISLHLSQHSDELETTPPSMMSAPEHALPGKRVQSPPLFSTLDEDAITVMATTLFNIL